MNFRWQQSLKVSEQFSQINCGHVDSSSKCLQFGCLHTKPEYYFKLQFLMYVNLQTAFKDLVLADLRCFCLQLLVLRLLFFDFTIFFRSTVNSIQNLFCIGVRSSRCQMPENGFFFPLLFLLAILACILLPKRVPPLCVWQTCAISCLSLPNP